eukprot:11768518-Alexandrium_andersonii.AAC.1
MRRVAPAIQLQNASSGKFYSPGSKLARSPSAPAAQGLRSASRPVSSTFRRAHCEARRLLGER